VNPEYKPSLISQNREQWFHTHPTFEKRSVSITPKQAGRKTWPEVLEI
jgi:hypothetical protein